MSARTSVSNRSKTIDLDAVGEIKANAAITDLIANINILTARADPLIKSIKSPKLLIRGLQELQSMIEMVDIKHSIIHQIKFLITNHARKQYRPPPTLTDDPTPNSTADGKVVDDPKVDDVKIIDDDPAPCEGKKVVDDKKVEGTKVMDDKKVDGKVVDDKKVDGKVVDDKKVDGKSSQFEGHMLHSVISGSPGTGKTTVGMILAKIWMALGFVNTSQPPKAVGGVGVGGIAGMLNGIGGAGGGAGGGPLTNNLVNTVNEGYRKRIQELEEGQRNDRRRMDRIRELLTRFQTTSSEIRRQSIRLRNPNRPTDDNEWNAFLANARDMRFGFDEIIREANVNINIIPAITPAEDEDPYENVDPKFIIAAREDFIAEYLGQTAPKTKKVLESARGGVLFIDEAYSLCNMDGGSKDKYGEECLTTINEFMSLYPEEIIIIFAGYKDKLMNSIFKAQPGLLRRCVHFFEIKDYTPKGMAKIFTRQLAKNAWHLDPSVPIEKILTDNKDLIQDGGGGTERLAFFVKIAYGNHKFEETIHANHPTIHDSLITAPMVAEALDLIRRSSSNELRDDPPTGWYL